MAEAWKTVKKYEARGFTNALLELMDEGVLSAESLVEDLLSWMSEGDVQEFCERRLELRDEDNECIIRLESEEDEDGEAK